MIRVINEFFRMLWLSVSSSEFYHDLYTKYKGYGVKYITMVISITSIIYAISFMYNINLIKNYLKPGTDQTDNPVEFILQSWPIIQYDGNNFFSENSAPIYLITRSGHKVAVIDIAGSLAKADLQKIPFVFTKSKLIIWLGAKENGQKMENFSIIYNKIFGTSPAVIDQDYIKNFLYNTLDQIGVVTFLLSIPIIIAIRLVIHIIRNLFSIGLLYSVLWWIKAKPNIQSSSRAVFFASGMSEFITPFILILYQDLMPLTIFVEYWAVMLAIYGIIIKRKTY